VLLVQEIYNMMMFNMQAFWETIMKKKFNKINKENHLKSDKSQKGTATIIAVMIMSLMTAFVALAVARTTSESQAMSNDIAESRVFSAAQASLENMTLNADHKFDFKLDLDNADIASIKASTPAGFPNLTFEQTLQKVRASEIVDATGEAWQGLKQIRDEWGVTTTVTDPATDVQSVLKRRFFNNRIPLFQFGIFYDDDLEFHPGPRFDFGGRVHSNGNLFLMAGTGLYFSSRVSAHRNVVSDVARNGYSANHWGDNVFIKNGEGNYVQLTDRMGSASHYNEVGPNLYATNPDVPPLYLSPTWDVDKLEFEGNLLANIKRLDLPLKGISSGGPNADYIELVRRGKAVGDKYNNGTGTALAPVIVPVTPATASPLKTRQQQYSNGTGIRVSLADSRDRLPGCGAATPPANCGVRLDGNADGSAYTPGNPRGYHPLAMNGGVRASRINGERFFNAGKEMWIRVEMVNNDIAAGTISTTDITQDILSLGVTEEQLPIAGGGSTPFTQFLITNSVRDRNSIIKLQRFAMTGDVIKPSSLFLTNYNWGGATYNFVVADDSDPLTVDDKVPNINLFDNVAHQATGTYLASAGGVAKTYKVVPYPITMFDTREGLYNDYLNIGTTFPSGRLPRAGVMSMVDIDVTNLRKFFNGEFNGVLPTNTPYAISKSNISLKANDVPRSRGWVFYVSDRRGDFDFDGEYDMEDIYGNNDGILQAGEDVNRNGTLQSNLTEAPAYSNLVERDEAAVINPSYYRRGVRLINGTRLPGNYNTVTPEDTLGFAFASENGVYVKGNYNATGISSVGTPTLATGFLPQNTTDHIPASIAADAISILSNAWQDSLSFTKPFAMGDRNATDTTIRFAMLAGDAMSSRDGLPNQGGGDPRLGGGVHNFKRFLEDWSGKRLNYSGSLINMFNSRNNNGAFKCCTNVYSPPTRNWSFDTTFLNPNRLPPSTPFFQTISLTGFERVNY
jgi:hypothetical protein